MRKLLIGLVALGAMAAAPQIASADHRFGGDRGGRYEGRGGSRSSFGLSIGFGSSSWDRGYSYSNFRYGYNSGGYGGGYGGGCAPSYRSYRPAYSCPPPVVYAPAPVIYSAPVYVAPPVVYYPAQPVYSSAPCPTGGYYYSTGAYYYGR
jgi:hypothetical protein